MNEEKYNYFIKICELGSITKAAESLYISQPALSKYLNRIESDLEVKLIEREFSPVKLTDAGEIYLKYSKEMLKRYNQMRNDISGYIDSAGKRLSVGVSSDLSKSYTNDVIKIAMEIDPNFDIRVVEDTSLNMVKLIEDVTVDAAFLGTDENKSDKIEYTVIKEDKICLVCGKKNPMLLNRKFENINGNKVYIFSKEEVENMQFYSREKSFKLAEMIDKYMAENGITIKDDVTVADLYTMLCLVRDTNRFAFFPEFFIEENKAANDIALCRIDDDVLRLNMVLAKLKHKRLPNNVTIWFNRAKDFYKADNK